MVTGSAMSRQRHQPPAQRQTTLTTEHGAAFIMNLGKHVAAGLGVCCAWCMARSPTYYTVMRLAPPELRERCELCMHTRLFPYLTYCVFVSVGRRM